jgi:hypothetical protein
MVFNFFNKRGQGHVEMIISLVLFVGFLFFVFVFLNPFTRTDRVVSIDEMQESIIDEISYIVGKLSVVVNTTGDCYKSEGFGGYGSSFVEVKDVVNLRRYTLYFGSFFNPNKVNVISCSGLENYNFSLGPYNKEKIIVYEEAERIVGEYNLNYVKLRNKIGDKDFSFNFMDLDRNQLNFLGSSDKLGVDRDSGESSVFSRDISTRMMDKDANIFEVILNIRVWE